MSLNKLVIFLHLPMFVLLLFAFASCGETNTKNQETNDEDDIETTFSPELIRIYFAGTKEGETTYSAALDSSGNVYVSGSTDGEFDKNVASGETDAFLAKFTSVGDIDWIDQWGTAGDDDAGVVAVDGNDDIVVAGNVAREIDGEMKGGSYDGFIRKFDSSGGIIWEKFFGMEASQTYVTGIALDNSGNIYVSGAVFGDLDGNVSAGNYDVFAAKFTSDGDDEWKKQWGSSEAEWFFTDIVSDSSGDLFITGTTEGPIGEKESFGGKDIFVTKVNKDGDIIFSKLFGKSENDSSMGITSDNKGNVYIAGSVKEVSDDGTKERNLLLKLKSNGVVLWEKVWGSGTAMDVEMLNNSEVIVSGIGVGYDDSEFPTGAVVSGTAYFALFNEKGEKLFSKQFGGSDSFATNVLSKSDDEFVISGFSSGDFDSFVSTEPLKVFVSEWLLRRQN